MSFSGNDLMTFR